MAYNSNFVSQLLTPEQMGTPNFGEAIKRGMQGSRDAMDTAAKPSQLAESLLAMKLKNAHDKTINQFLPRSEEARISSTEESTLGQKIRNQYLPRSEEARLNQQEISNQFLPEHERATIDNLKALTKNRGSALSNMTAFGKDEQMFANNVALDNPQLSPEQVRQAAESYAKGEEQLQDGTPLMPMSAVTQRTLDALTRRTTPSALITQAVKSSQAEAEIEEADKFLDEIGRPYGDTYFGVSPEQIIDSTSNSPDAQKRMGAYMGTQALQYELAQIRNRLAGGEPGISATAELMGHSGQIIKNYAPHMSSEARREAERVINEGLKRMSAARKKVGISPSTLNRKMSEGGSSDNDMTYNPETGRLE